MPALGCLRESVFFLDTNTKLIELRRQLDKRISPGAGQLLPLRNQYGLVNIMLSLVVVVLSVLDLIWVHRKLWRLHENANH